MRNRIFGGIGMVWGGAILISAFFRGSPQGSAAYATGHTAGLVFGALLFIVGGFYLLRRDGKKA